MFFSSPSNISLDKKKLRGYNVNSNNSRLQTTIKNTTETSKTSPRAEESVKIADFDRRR